MASQVNKILITGVPGLRTHSISIEPEMPSMMQLDKTTTESITTLYLEICKSRLLIKRYKKAHNYFEKNKELVKHNTMMIELFEFLVDRNLTLSSGTLDRIDRYLIIEEYPRKKCCIIL